MTLHRVGGVVDRMVGYTGADISADDRALILSYIDTEAKLTGQSGGKVRDQYDIAGKLE